MIILEHRNSSLTKYTVGFNGKTTFPFTEKVSDFWKICIYIFKMFGILPLFDSHSEFKI